VTDHDGHRRLVDQLRTWPVGQIAELVLRRCDLAEPAPRTLDELAQRAQSQPSIEAAIAATTLPENRLLQVAVCCRPGVPLDELAAALPPGVTLAQVEATLVSLERSALVWRHQGRLYTSEVLYHVMPTAFGPPLDTVAADQTVEYLKGAIAALRRAVAGHPVAEALPAPPSGPGGRPPRKAELVDGLAALLAVPGLVGAVLDGAPEKAAELARAMAGGSPLTRLDHPLYYSNYGMGRYFRDQPAYWLFERGLVFSTRGEHLAVQPRQVGVSLRDGRPVADLALERPELETGAAPEGSDAAGATRAVRTLDLLADLLERWDRAPAKTLKAGGLGVTVMKQTAAALELDLAEANRLVELARVAGLVETVPVHRTVGRQTTFEFVVGPVEAAPAWLDRPAPARWSHVGSAWLEAEHWPSAPGTKIPGVSSAAVMSGRVPGRARELRHLVLDALACLAPGRATTPEALAAAVFWRRPQCWLDFDTAPPATRIGWIYAEAEVLGMVAGGALTGFGRHLLAGRLAPAQEALAAAAPAAETTVTLQADLTATAVGRLDRQVAGELRLMADVESTGPATTWRFSEASLRRALDAGREGPAILAFLEAHAPKGVPAPLAYLVGDVHRRHGHLVVAPATTVVTSEDPAVLADACSHPRTRKLGLRRLAPTVAVSSQPSTKVLDTLRAAGFLPAPGGDGGGDPVGVVEPVQGTDWRTRSEGEMELAPPYTWRPHPRARARPAVDPAGAAQLAEAVVAAGSPPPGLDEALADVLTRAVAQSRVLGIVLGDDGRNPLCLAVTRWDTHRVDGIDVADGSPASVEPDTITSVVDLGPLEEFASLALLGSDRHGGRQGRRRR